MRKKKYIIAALAVGMCVSGITGNTVSAEKQQAEETAETDTSKEETAYREFLKDPENYSADKDLDGLVNAVYDVNQDGTKELILCGKNADEEKYRYSFYRYEDGEVKPTGSMEIRQDNGDGKLYYAKEENGIALLIKTKDKDAYSLYQAGKRIRCSFTIHRQKSDTDKKYQYNLTDENGETIDQKITKKDWNKFKEELKEISFSAINSGISEDMQVSEDEEQQGGISPVINDNSDAVNVVSQVSGLEYIGNQSYVRSLHRNEDSSAGLVPDTGSGILSAFPEDFDGDGKPEIFSVIYEGRVHFLMLRRAGESWEIISDQEILSSSQYNDYDYSSLDKRGVKEEDSVFFRKYNGSYEFFYEVYDEGLIATGQEWFFKGFRLEDGKLNPIDATDSLYFSGSPIDIFWENYEGEAGDSLDKFCSLGFVSPRVYFGNMTVDSNSGLYPILRMTKDATCPVSDISQWMANSSSDLQNGFSCKVEDRAGEIPENVEEFSGGSTSAEQSSLASDSSEYILPESATRYLGAEEIAGLSLNDIQNAINEIFARHGRAFQTAEIAAYFQAKSWYHPDASKTDDQITAEFNEYEKANEKLLENRRDELSGTHGK